jgi:hypothetical protein
MNKLFQVILTNERDEDDYIVLDTVMTEEHALYLLDWYESHKRFFKGEFSIRDASC